jgi:hypothetical protein
MWWCMSIILATQEAEVGGWEFEVSLGDIVWLYLKKKGLNKFEIIIPIQNMFSGFRVINLEVKFKK